MKNIAILGSTGSIGMKTLQVIRDYPENFRVRALAAGRNWQALYQQGREFRPDVVCLFDQTLAPGLEKKLKPLRIPVVSGEEGLRCVSTHPPVEQVICAMVGASGLVPIFEALKAGKILGIANKEPLVVAGSLLMKEARRRKVPVFPIDSEHSGLWQCLEGRLPRTIQRLILTSSGGPFLKSRGSLENITPGSALRHPRWKMGPKITIDSATLMNKGLEVIEATNLFGMPADRVDVLIHPEAIVHALVEFVDGSELAHLSVTDMRLPIQYALSYPERLNHSPRALNLAKVGALHFQKPDTHRFPCLALGYEASRAGESMPAVLNAANEVAVEAFLDRRVQFTDISKIIEKTMAKHPVYRNPSLADVLAADRWARGEAWGIVGSLDRS